MAGGTDALRDTSGGDPPHGLYQPRRGCNGRFTRGGKGWCSSVSMSPHQATDSAISAWYEAPGTIREILSPEMRFRTPWGGGELADAVQNAHHWLIAHRRPDPSISGHLAALLDAYAEMPHATTGRIMELREIIGQNSHAVSRGRVPRPAHGSPGR